MAFIVFMILFGIVIEVLRAITLRRRHRLTLDANYQRRARGEDVPRL